MNDDGRESEWAELAQVTGPVAGLLLRAGAEGEPLIAAEVAAAINRTVEEVAQILAGFGCRIDNDGRVILGDPGVADGLPLYTVHILDTGRAMQMPGCLVDAFFVQVVTGRPIRVEGTCPVTGRLVAITVNTEGVATADPAEAVASGIPLNRADPTDPAASACAHGHVFVSAAAASTWLAEHPEGELGSIADAVRAAFDAKPYLLPPGHDAAV